ncbi:MAG: cobalt ECF transporter T component CbiQ [Firmicutes bacterium]|nr:cobalt ECF transporter T component CbiQ [Bacillota bacterium]
MSTGILTASVVWCLFYGRVPPAPLVLLCVVLGIGLALLGRHKHGRVFMIDVYAQVSRLNQVNAVLKFWTVLVLLGLCISARGPAAGGFLIVAMPVLVVGAGGLALRDYIQILALPVSFLLLSGLALLFDASLQPCGVFAVHIFGFWLCVSPESQVRTTLVIARALGAVSCLYLLSLTTPMAELIGVLRRVRCPAVLIDLMYLIYRYIFILVHMHYTMRDAAKTRLGYVDYRASVRTTGSLYTNLLARSYRQANINFDAMESRCYDTQILFLENEAKANVVQYATAIGITMITLTLSFLVH